MLSLLFTVFALASLFDPKKEPYSVEAQDYYYVARAILSFVPPVQSTYMFSVQILVGFLATNFFDFINQSQIHMAQFCELSHWETCGSNQAWSDIGHAVRLGQKVIIFQIFKGIIIKHFGPR